MDLDLPTLRAFVAVAELGSFSKAAIQLHRVQSAVSQQIKRLETLLDATLFERDRRNVKLSAEGRTFLPYAHQMLSLNEASAAALKMLPRTVTLKLGVTDTLASCWLSDLLQSVSEWQPRMQVVVECDYSPQLWSRFRAGGLDVVIAQSCPPDISSDLLYAEPLQWVTSTSGTAHTDEILALAMFTEGCSDRDSVLMALEAARRRYRIAFTSRSHAAILAGVDSGQMVAALPRRAAGGGTARRHLSDADGLPTLKHVAVSMATRQADSTSPCQALARVARMLFHAPDSDVGRGVPQLIRN